jgi:hypothetical protein
MADADEAIGAATTLCPCRHCHSQNEGIAVPLISRKAIRPATIERLVRRAIITLNYTAVSTGLLGTSFVLSKLGTQQVCHSQLFSQIRVSLHERSFLWAS